MAGATPRDTIYHLARRWGGPAFLALLLVMLAAWSWRKWPDILIDFGRELYVPWQLTGGKVLYRDIAYLNGPLSPYLNAWWFRIFGVSLSTLIFSNIMVLAGITALIYNIMRKSCDRLTATVSCTIFLCIFGFSHLDWVGNYNYVTPYSHELTHGIFLSLLLLILLSGYCSQPSRKLIAFSGLCCGVIFLGKGEIFLAAVAVALVAVLLSSIINKISLQNTLAIVFILIIFTLIPAFLFFLYFYPAMPASQALYGLLGTWKVFLSPSLISSHFYRVCTGLDQPLLNLMLMLRESAGVVLLTAAAALANADIHRCSGVRKSSGVCLLLAGALAVKDSLLPLLLAGRPLPFITMVMGGIIVYCCLKNRDRREAMAKLAPLALWAALALALLTKIFLNARVCDFGFVLAMPAMLLWVVSLLWLLPGLLRERYGRGRWFRVAVMVMLVVDLVFHLQASAHYYQQKNFLIGKGKIACSPMPPRLILGDRQ